MYPPPPEIIREGSIKGMGERKIWIQGEGGDWSIRFLRWFGSDVIKLEVAGIDTMEHCDDIGFERSRMRWVGYEWGGVMEGEGPSPLTISTSVFAPLLWRGA